MLKIFMGKPAIQENALTKCVDSWDEKTQNYVRREVYVAFFARFGLSSPRIGTRTTSPHGLGFGTTSREC